jgi:hypothetical protein
MPGRYHEHQHRESRPKHPARTGNPAPREAAPTKQLPSEADLLTRLHAGLEELVHELSQGKSDHLLQYLNFAAQFHHYSRANQMLILMQMPTATHVASYKRWQELGFQVAKGETGIRILAPSIRKAKKEKIESAETEELDQPSPEEPDKTVVRFVAVSVLDQSQLTPEKRPLAFFTPLEGDADSLYQHLVSAATEDGFTVVESPDTGGAEGFSRRRLIVTRTGLPSVNRALTTIHEYTHGLLHQNVHTLGLRRDVTKEIKECHAEAVSYIVAKHFGIANPFSSDYLLQWGTTPETLRTELDSVVAAASHIIHQVEGPSNTPDDPSVAPVRGHHPS